MTIEEISSEDIREILQSGRSDSLAFRALCGAIARVPHHQKQDCIDTLLSHFINTWENRDRILNLAIENTDEIHEPSGFGTELSAFIEASIKEGTWPLVRSIRISDDALSGNSDDTFTTLAQHGSINHLRIEVYNAKHVEKATKLGEALSVKDLELVVGDELTTIDVQKVLSGFVDAIVAISLEDNSSGNSLQENVDYLAEHCSCLKKVEIKSSLGEMNVGILSNVNWDLALTLPISALASLSVSADHISELTLWADGVSATSGPFLLALPKLTKLTIVARRELPTSDCFSAVKSSIHAPLLESLTLWNVNSIESATSDQPTKWTELKEIAMCSSTLRSSLVDTLLSGVRALDSVQFSRCENVDVFFDHLLETKLASNLSCVKLTASPIDQDLLSRVICECGESLKHLQLDCQFEPELFRGVFASCPNLTTLLVGSCRFNKLSFDSVLRSNFHVLRDLEIGLADISLSQWQEFCNLDWVSHLWRIRIWNAGSTLPFFVCSDSRPQIVDASFVGVQKASECIEQASNAPSWIRWLERPCESLSSPESMSIWKSLPDARPTLQASITSRELHTDC